jgi:hypothetical protein
MGPSHDAGRPAWFILRKYDSRLLPESQQAAFKAPDLSHFTERQRNTALARKWCVDQFRIGRRNARLQSADVASKVMAEAKRLFPDLDVSFSSIQRWHRLYAQPCDLVKLFDQRGGDMRHDGSAEAWEAFKGIYCDQRQPSIRQTWEIVRGLAADNGWGWGSYKSCVRNLNRFIPPAVQTFHRQPAKYRSSLATYVAQDSESWAAGENYIGDHKALDVLARWGEGFTRPWLTSWMDWRTRKICGWVLSDCPNSDTILAALRNAIVDESNMGGPSHVTIDNGRYYTAYVFNGTTKRERLSKISLKLDEGEATGIFNMVGITAHFCIPFSPNGKSRLERFHRDLEPFCKSFRTYTGWNTQTKPESLAEYLKKPTLAPTLKEVEGRLGDFIKGYNLNADHAIGDLAEDGHTLSPCEAFAKWCPTRRVMSDPASLDLLLAHWRKPVYVQRDGITLTLDGTPSHYGQDAPELMPFKALSKKDRRPVFVTYDPSDLSTIRVFDEHKRFIVTAGINSVGGAICRIDQNAYKEVARKRRAYNHSLKVQRDYGLTGMLSHNEQLAREAGEQHRKAVAEAAASAQPPALRIVSTPLDGQSRELRRQEVKTAFGTRPAVRKLGPLLPAPPARLRPALVLHRNPEEEMRRLAHAVNQ